MLKHTQFLTALGHIYFWDIPKEEPRLKGKANLFHKNFNFQKANLKVSQMYVFLYLALLDIFIFLLLCNQNSICLGNVHRNGLDAYQS